jgi:RimJ/RimL family protein N-acetyltransferase
LATPGPHRAYAKLRVSDTGSRAVMASVGMSYVRTFAGDFDDPLPGSYQGEVEYAISRDQWRDRRGHSIASL